MKHGIVVVVCGLLCGCALLDRLRDPVEAEVETPPAHVAVEILRGDPIEKRARAGGDERVAVVIDATASMSTESAPGRAMLAAARGVAQRMVTSLPPEQEIALHVLRGSDAADCVADPSQFVSAAGDSRDSVTEPLSSVEAGAEASLAEGIAAMAVVLGEAGEARPTRLVVLSDLSGECGGSLCRALAEVVARDARVELVVFGDGPVPVCIDALDLAAVWSFPREVAVSFRVEDVGDPVFSTTGLVDGGVIAAPTGSVRIVVDIDPPETFGPVELAPGDEGRLRVLDFPDLVPPVREVTWELRSAVEVDGEGAASDVP